MRSGGVRACQGWPPTVASATLLGHASFAVITEYRHLMYIDPGAGSLIVQVIGSALIAVAASFTHVKRFVARLLGRKRD